MPGPASGRTSALDATVDALLPEWPGLPLDRRALVSRHCAAFVRRQIGLAPAHVRLGIHVLFAAFCIVAAVRFGLALPRERRAAALAWFARAPVPPFAALERVLRSMTTVAFLDHPEVVKAVANAGPAAGA